MRKEIISFDRLTKMRLRGRSKRLLQKRIPFLGLREIIQIRNSAVLKFTTFGWHRL